MLSETSDKAMLDVLRRNGAVTISALVAEMGVTATAVRQRLQRLMADGLIERQTENKGRGRPNHRYSLTEKGERSAGTNFADMADVLWDEIKSVEDPEIRRGLLKRIAGSAGGAVSQRRRRRNAGRTDDGAGRRDGRARDSVRGRSDRARCRCCRRWRVPIQNWPSAIAACARWKS